MEEKSNPEICARCNAKCCKSISIQWKTPGDAEEWDNIKWLVAHKNVHFYQDHEGDWFIEFLTDCAHVAPDNTCMIYNSRPTICRTYDTVDCERITEGEYYKKIFRTLPEIEQHMLKNNIRKEV
jgi:Fe-S-cluster containining protein